ncbi:hypothetical protein [Spirosoma validum]|uniref:Uncharacterized protein n=1 Tax=Spirosoma validum TaxID=2771355 RepID=A0A927B4V8_9BACT|nr:hypothetical protein [Spirosoma validum]MBD2755689.1 hypothetical protein [Spirosoma validum]
MEDVKSFETALLKRLSHAQFDKEFLRSASSSIMEFRKMGYDVNGAFPMGKLAFDSILIRGTINPEAFTRIKDLLKVPTLKTFEVFPIGIIGPDVFQFKATLGL